MAQSVKSDLEEALVAAQKTIEEQKKALAALTAPPLVYATVVSSMAWTRWDGEKVAALQVVINGSLMLVETPAGQEYSPGETIVVHPLSSQIVGRMKGHIPGHTGVVTRVIDDLFTEVDVQGNSTILFHGPHASLSAGDSVLVDRSNTSIMRLLSEGTSRFDFSTDTHVTWDMIGGLDQAKRDMRDAIELPLKHPDIFAFYNQRPCSGILLFGPPGCGKTMLGKAAASSIGTEGFMYIKGPEILERYVGVAEQTIRSAFGAARMFKEKNNRPAVMFIDEADAILSKRGTGVSSDIEKTIVPTFLSEMDGLEDSGTIVILTTNREDTLDPAIIRDGRIDKKIRVTRPEKADAFSIMERLLHEAPVAKGHSPGGLAALAADELYSNKRILYILHEENGPVHAFNLHHTMNGAMAHSVIREAKSRALHRDLGQGSRLGLTEGDIRAAIDSIEHQNRLLDQDSAITEHVQTINKKIARVQRFSLEEHLAAAASQPK